MLLTLTFGVYIYVTGNKEKTKWQAKKKLQKRLTKF